MNEKEKRLINKLFEIIVYIINNLNTLNIDDVLNQCIEFENKLKKKIETDNKSTELIWMQFSNMSEDDIIREFNDINKYPNINSIKLAVKGFLEMRKVSNVKTRKTLIKHIIDTYRRGEYISDIGKKDV